MSIRPVRLLHISDPHFGPQHNSRVAEEFFDALRQIDPCPDLAIISGDFSKLAESRSYADAAAFIRQVQEITGIDDGRVHVVPGNHDFNRFGFFFSPQWSLKTFRSTLGRYYQRGEWQVYPEFNLSLLCLDSSDFTALERVRNLRPWRITRSLVDGKIGRRQLLKLRKEYQAHQEKREGPALEASRRALCSYKVAVLHHHPLPVPVVGEEHLAVIQDAGDLLRELCYCDFDLVLHGHQHFPYLAEVRYLRYPQRRKRAVGTLLIAGAGSVTAKQPSDPSNHFAVIDIDARDSSSPRTGICPWVYQAGSFDQGEASIIEFKKPERGSPMAAQEAVDMVARAIGYRRLTFALKEAIAADGGADCEATTEIQPLLSQLPQLHIRIASDTVQPTSFDSWVRRHGHPVVQRAGVVDPYSFALIPFDPPLRHGENPKVELRYKCAPGTYYPTQAALDDARKSAKSAPVGAEFWSYDFCLHAVGVPTERIELEIEFHGLAVSDLRPVVFSDNVGTLIPNETARVKKLATGSENRIRIEAEKPIFGARYGFLWRPPG